jgi:hypothetical protein
MRGVWESGRQSSPLPGSSAVVGSVTELCGGKDGVTPEPRVNSGVNGTDAAGAAGSLEHPSAGRSSSKTGSRDMGHLPVSG